MKTAKRNGFTLVESLMAVLIFSLSGLAFSSFVSISANTQSKNKAKMSVAQSKGQVLAMIANRSVWFRNLKDADEVNHPHITNKKLNPELACLRDGTLCAETETGYDLTLTDQNGNIVVDGIDSTKGFTKEGAVCSGFSASTPNPACPWRLSLKWSPICPTAADCLHPQVNIKVSISASAAFLESNNLTATQASVMVQQPKTQPAFAKKILMVTNSLHYGYPSSVTIDPSSYVISDSPGKISFSIPKTVSVRGGTVSISGQSITYSPAYEASVVPVPTEKIFGTDWFNYKIKDSYTGLETVATIYVQVMTPYTWTGLAGGGDLSITTQKNFCGKVVDGNCDGLTFPAAFMNGSKDTNLIFNETCTNCNVDIGTRILTSSLETSPYYSGTITQRADVVAGYYPNEYGQSTWRKTASFKFTSGLWEGQAGALVVPRQGEAFVCWMCLDNTPLHSFFSLEGGTFKAPPIVQVVGSLYMPNAAAFKHNGGTFYWMGSVAWGALECAGDCYIGSDGVEFWNLVTGYPKSSEADTQVTSNGITFGFGWGRRTFLQNNFNVLGNLTVANVGTEGQLTTKVGASVNLHGDLILPTFNSGGDYSYGRAATVNMIGTNDQQIIGQVLNETEKQTPTRVNCAPSIIVDKPSGKLTVKGTIALFGDFLIKNAGSYEMQNVNLVVPPAAYNPWSTLRHIGMNGQEIEGFYHTGGRADLWDDLIVKTKFFHNAGGTAIFINKAGGPMKYVHIRGDAEFGPIANFSHDYADQASTFLFDGTGDQSVTSSMALTGAIGNHFHVNKTSGTITFNGSLGVMQDFLLHSGNVVFGPTFGIHNKNTGADFIRTRVSLNDPVNQVISKIETNRTLEVLTPVYAENLVLNANIGWWGNHYTNLYGGVNPIYVSKDLTFDSKGTAGAMGARTSTQKIILNGTGAQKISILDSASSGSLATIDLQVQNASASPVTILGNGRILNLTVAPGSTVDLDAASTLALTGVVSGVLNKNGTTPTGSLTVFGAGVINN
ncbi:MAG: PulJ/GspJ family protein [Pseudobdellovibrionaceae bacterium]